MDQHPARAACPAGRGLVVVSNPSAGSAPGAAEALKDLLPEAEMIEPPGADAVGQVLQEAAGRAVALGVVGGDGTVNVAAEVAAGRGKPLLVVPGGTLNHFAGALGLATVADAAEAVDHGDVALVDRGIIDGRTFLNTASIGSYVDLVDARERLEGRIGKWPAVALALPRVLRHSSPVCLEVDGRACRVWMVFVGNCRYDPAGFAPSSRERLDDGLLDIRTVSGEHPWSRVRLLAAVATGRLGRCRAYEQRFERQVSVRSRQGPLRLARDGETFDGSHEFVIHKAPTSLQVYVPPRGRA